MKEGRKQTKRRIKKGKTKKEGSTNTRGGILGQDLGKRKEKGRKVR